MPLNLRCMLSTAFIAGMALTAFASGADAGKDALWLKLKDGSDSSAVARKLVSGLGTVVRKDAERDAYLIRVSPKLSYLNVIRHLERQKVVAEVEGHPEQVAPMGPQRNSLAGVERFVKALKAMGAEEEHEDEEKGESAEGKIARLDYLEAWLTWFRPRAYPNDTIDASAYARGVQQREQMPAGRVFQGRSRNDISGSWQYVGPKNLDVPYTIYWGPRPVAGRPGAMAYSPTDPNTIYVTGAMGGLMKSTNGGASFTPLSDGWSSLAASSIAIDPFNSNVVYVGGGDAQGFASLYSFGLKKSTDGGATWTSLPLPGGLPSLVTIADIQIDPTDSNIITAVTGDWFTWGNIIRSTNGGATWSVVNSDQVQWCNIDVSAPDGSGNRTYYAAGASSPEQIWKSTDKGATWTKLTGLVPGSGYGYSMLVACSKISPTTLYALAPTRQKLYKSTNGGTSWTDTTSDFPGGYNWSQYYYNYSLMTGTTGGGTPQDVIYAGQIDVVVSRNGGANWASIGGPTYSWSAITHNDQHALALNPQNGDELLVGNDGGVYRYTYNVGTGTYTSQSLNVALPITMFYHAAFHPTNPNIMIGGTQDNATPFANGDLNNWSNIVGGDGAGCVIYQANPNIQYASSQYWNIVRTTNNWASGTSLGAPSTLNQPFIGELWEDPNQDAIYAANNQLFRWSASTGAWSSALGGGLSFGSNILAVAVAPGDSNTIYVGTTNGLLFVSRNGGSSFSQIQTGSPSLPNRSIMDLSVNPTNKDDILIGLGGTGSNNLYRCSNTAAVTRVYSSVSGTGGTAIPGVPLNTIARDPWQTSTWYVGTDLGAFMTKDAGSTWSNISSPLGLPNAQINVLRAVPGTGYLMAATYGRGMWRIQIKDGTSPLVTGLSIAPGTIDAAGTATGTVTLSGTTSSNLTVNLSATTGATVPATVTVPAGASSATFTVTGSLVATDTTSTVTASTTSPASSATATVLVKATQKAQFVSQTVPTLVDAGRSFSVSVTMKNTGSIPWTAANRYRLASRNPNDNTTWGVNRAFLTSTETINPGDSKTFTFNVTAPAALGTYNFQWSMVKDAGVYFGDLTTNVPITVQTPLNDSQFVAQAFSTTTMGAGNMYKANVRFKNTGRGDWTRPGGHKLASSNPRYNSTWGFDRAVLGRAEVVTPGTEKTFELWVTAPATNGSYNFQWQMQQEGVEWFGPVSPNQIITVVAPTEKAQFVSQSVPTTVVRNATFNVTITMKNTGTVAWTQASAYKLLSWNPMGNSTFGVNRVNLATGESIAPGASKTFTFACTAPRNAGTYNFQWRMTRENRSIFGDTTVNVPIVVTN